jgi:hypothetical protein
LDRSARRSVKVRSGHCHPAVSPRVISPPATGGRGPAPRRQPGVRRPRPRGDLQRQAARHRRSSTSRRQPGCPLRHHHVAGDPPRCPRTGPPGLWHQGRGARRPAAPGLDGLGQRRTAPWLLPVELTRPSTAGPRRSREVAVARPAPRTRYARPSCPPGWRAPVAQRIEHLTTDQEVRGSNPFGCTQRRRSEAIRPPSPRLGQPRLFTDCYRKRMPAL